MKKKIKKNTYTPTTRVGHCRCRRQGERIPDLIYVCMSNDKPPQMITDKKKKKKILHHVRLNDAQCVFKRFSTYNLNQFRPNLTNQLPKGKPYRALAVPMSHSEVRRESFGCRE